MKPSRLIGWPSRLIRSRTSMRCGDVKRPTFMPKAVSTASIILAALVLPFVPVTWTEG